jgi:eukaryotic-like serine/threonine-protein kinase
MPTSKEPPTVILFGVFEADLTSQELRKRGVRLRLPRQSFQILKMLLERPGELVTRDELRAALWPLDTFVDFEHGLNAAINRLRDALGDKADDPRFVETLPRRGYRFIGEVGSVTEVKKETRTETAAAVPASTESPTVGETLLPSAPAQVCATDHQSKVWPLHKRLGPWMLRGLVVGVVSVLVVSTLLVVRSRRPVRLTEKDPIVLTDFANSTGDAVFDDTLRQGLIVQLEQSPYLNVVPESRIQETLQFMGQKPGERPSMEQWHEVCERSYSTTLLTGSIARLGSQYVIGLNAEECKTGRHLADEQVQVRSKEEVLKGLGVAATSLRKKLGESLASIQKFDVPLEQVTTPSLEALQAYTRGQKTFDEKGYTLAMPFFERAIELDPNFAMAYEFLAMAHMNLGQEDVARQMMEKAFGLRDRASERERLLISSIYYGWIVGDQQRGMETLQLMAQTFPRASVAHLLLAVEYGDTGQWERVIREEQEALRLDRASAVDYSRMAQAYVRLGQLDAAEKTIQEATTHYPDVVYFQGTAYEIAFLRGDTAGMEQALRSVNGKDFEPALLMEQAETEAYYGRMARSREITARLTELARQKGSPAVLAFTGASGAAREALVGNLDLARQRAHSALEEKPSRNSLELLAGVLASTGDTAKAETICRTLQKENPNNTYIRDYWLPLIRAQMDLAQHHPAAALTAVEPALAFDLGTGRLFPTYLRGLAYLQAGDGVSAAGEFQKVLDQPSITVNAPYGALARLGLARALALQGKTELARGEYGKFLGSWKEADGDVQILREAKQEAKK